MKKKKITAAMQKRIVEAHSNGHQIGYSQGKREGEKEIARLKATLDRRKAEAQIRMMDALAQVAESIAKLSMSQERQL